MSCGTPAPSTQSLPDEPEADSRRAADYLRCLREIGHACAVEVGPADIASPLARLIVEHCVDIVLAVVYRADAGGQRAVLQARAGLAPAAAPVRAGLELPQPFTWERPDAATDDAGSPRHRIVVALAPTPGSQPLGWLLLEAEGPDTAVRTLFAEAAAQALAAAMARAAAHAMARARARREEQESVFLGKISNEFRTPLTLLLGPLEAAAERLSDAGLKVALRHGYRLKRLVDALLDLSHIDAGAMDPVLQPIDIAAMTRDVASLFNGAAAAAGIALTIDCPRLPQPVPVDRVQWEQVIINLLGNAIKFTRAGEVRITLRADVGLMTLDVSDTGVGIEPADLPHVFDRFHQASDRGDSGLGLALVHELVRLHGGDIEASSVPGRGSRFRVCIPMLGHPARAVPHRSLAGASVRTSRSRPSDALGWAVPVPAFEVVDAETVAAARMRERIVLVVDHRELRDYVAGLLRPRYRVQSLATGLDALQAVQDRAPDLVLVDLAGGPLHGLEFMRRLRASPHGAVVPALLLSSDTREFAHADAMEAGADDVIAKPFLAAQLLIRVAAHMRLSRDRRELHRRLASHNRDLEAQVAQRTSALAASEAQFKAISNLVPDILWRADAQGRIEWRSEQWRRFTGDEGHAQEMDFVHREDRAATQAWLQETVSRRTCSPHECRLRRHDGAYRWFIARMSPMLDSAGRVERWFGSATDIERHRLARHALEVQVDERSAALARASVVQRELLHRLSRSQEDERRRIARELHDSLGQYLTALKLALGALSPAIGDPQLRERVEHLDAMTTEVDRELDDIIAALRPVVLDELGLAGALPGIVADWSRHTGIAAEALLVQVGDERFDEDSESALYRVTQESLTNVVKHARAGHVAVTLSRRGDELHLAVEDDGVGFDSTRHGGGWGLRGMVERARSVGGVLQVESTPEAGTTVLMRVPYRPRAPSLALVGLVPAE